MKVKARVLECFDITEGPEDTFTVTLLAEPKNLLSLRISAKTLYDLTVEFLDMLAILGSDPAARAFAVMTYDHDPGRDGQEPPAPSVN